MATITIEPGRLHSDIRANTTLKDNGVAVDWNGLSDIRAYLYSDRQKAIAGPFIVAVDSEDGTKLVCDYPATLPQYEGINRIIVRCVYEGRTKTYDKPFINLVEWTEELADGEVVMEDPEVDVSLEVTEVSTSLLDEAIQAAFDAAEAAMAACGHIPYIGGNGNWFVWDSTLGEFVDSGKPSRGQQGIQGIQGEQGETGDDGKSIYQLAVDHGYEGTEEEFVAEYNAAVAAASAAAEAAAASIAAAEAAAEAAGDAKDAALAAAQTAGEKAAEAAEKAADAEDAAAAAREAAAEVEGAAEDAQEAAALATEKAGAAADAAASAQEAAGAAEDAGDYAKEQGDYAKGEIDGAKGDFESLNERFENTENQAIFIDPTTDPSDTEYQDEYLRILEVLYQAIDDVREALGALRTVTSDTREATSSANAAAAEARSAAAIAQEQAVAAMDAAAAAIASTNAAKGSFPSLNARIENIEATKQENIADLVQIRENAGKGATAYQKPATGIPSEHMTAEVQASLSKADTALQFDFEDDDDPASLFE